jgi:ATP-binding cassette subfamily B protein
MTDELLLERRYEGEHPFRTLIALYKGEYLNLSSSVGFYIIKHSGVWAMPLITASIIDIVSDPDKHSIRGLWFYLGILLVLLIVNIPTHYLFILKLSTATRNMETGLRSALTRRMQQLSMDFYTRHSTGALQTKLLRDVEILQQLTQNLFNVLPAAIITLVFALIVTMIRAPLFLLFYILIVPVAATVIYKLRGALKSRNRDFREEVETMSSSLIEMLRLIPVTRAHGIEQEELQHIQAKLTNVRDSGLRLDTMNALFGASSWVTFRLFETICLAVAAYFAYNHMFSLTVGDVVLLTGFFSNLTNAVLQISNIFPEITRGFESIHSLAEILECPDIEHNTDKIPVTSVEGHITFNHVSFGYPDTADSSLSDINLEVKPGETVAIVGQSGAGKSTLLNLVIGFLRPSTGSILLDGRDMNTLDLRTYRRFLSVVPQETVLFEGTVRQNILYGMNDIEETRLQQAIDDANVREFLDQLPDGLETLIGERGARLSGGQRQRLAIARALVRDPRVLILDEATSALDTASEVFIQEALQRLMKNRTTFIVAHRLSTVQRADRIIVLDAGRVAEVGTHTALLHKGGLYAHLHAAPEASLNR